MSEETYEWLNTMVLVGNGVIPWHNDEGSKGAESNLYPGPIPVEDVRRRLFGWKVVEGDITSKATILSPEGVEVVTITDDRRKSSIRPPGALGPDDKGAILGVHMDSWQGHDYEEWLLDQVAILIDDQLGIGSAGLLKGGAQAFVSIEIPEHITTREGVKFKPRLLAVTSFDHSLATTFKRVIKNAVCDNTMRAGLAEHGQQFKVKHTKNSHLKLTDARKALEISFSMADDFAAEVGALCGIKVSDSDWRRYLDIEVPLKNDDGEDLKGRTLTNAINKRDALIRLYNHDNRVAPWKGTAWGVLQAMNTYVHHEQTVRGAERAERNMNLAVAGAFDKLDAETFATLRAVIA